MWFYKNFSPCFSTCFTFSDNHVRKNVNKNGKITHPFWEPVVYSKTDTVSEEPLLLSLLVFVGMTKPPPPCGYPEVFYKHDKVFQIRWHITNIQSAKYGPTHCMCVCDCAATILILLSTNTISLMVSAH
jgi:hypothetical protein